MIEAEDGTKSEVVCVDRRTPLKGMADGNALPDNSQQLQIPHHMLEMFDTDIPRPRGIYQAIARACMRDISSRGRLPMLVGGSNHLMEALAYYDRPVHMEPDDDSVLWKINEVRLGRVAIKMAGGLPFETDRRRLINYIAERRALRNKPDQPRYGTLLLGVHRDPDEHKERIRLRTEQMYPNLAAGWGNEIKRYHSFYPEEIINTIGFGDFATTVNKGVPSLESIFKRTLAFAEWQVASINKWMPGLHWVRSADEAFERYKKHIASLKRTPT